MAKYNDPEQLRALADRIDHEQLWRWAGMDNDKMTPEQKDRHMAGVYLRRYAIYLGSMLRLERTKEPSPCGALDAMSALGEKSPDALALRIGGKAMTDGKPMTIDALMALVNRYAEACDRYAEACDDPGTDLFAQDATKHAALRAAAAGAYAQIRAGIEQYGRERVAAELDALAKMCEDKASRLCRRALTRGL